LRTKEQFARQNRYMTTPPILGADSDAFPDPDSALRRPNGLLAMGGDLSPDRLVAAYRRGIFPWFSAGEPILWWSPDPRLVLRPDAFKLTRSLRKRVRAAGWRISCDTAFLPVIHACAHAPRPGQDGTWIVPEMIAAYLRLHRLGIAHSVEVWDGHRLVGGLYGLAIGRMYFGESMFSAVPDASKAALWALCARLEAWGWPLIDCQQETAHLVSLGAEPMARGEFVAKVADLTRSSDWNPVWRSESLPL
jgi:leucyl/phenylalanyl-tRNA--protein transferase